MTNDASKKGKASLMKRLAEQAMEGAKRVAALQGQEALRSALDDRFPNLTPEHLKQGWVPIPQTALEQRLVSALQGYEKLNAIRLRCLDGRFEVEADLDAYWVVQSRVSLELEPKRFALNAEKKWASFTCPSPLQVEGRSFVGRVVNSLVDTLIIRMLADPANAALVATNTDELLLVDWPDVDVDLGRLSLVQQVAASSVLGLRALDFLRFGPLEVHQEHARVKVELTPKARRLVGVVADGVSAYRSRRANGERGSGS